MMKIRSVERIELAALVFWDDHSSNELPFIWLRDNDPHELHPHTGERTFDLSSVELDIQPLSQLLNEADQELIVVWPNKDEPSRYSAEWLYAHRPGISQHDAASIEKKAWTASEMSSLPRFSAEQCRNDAAFFSKALRTLKTTGLILIDELDDDLSAGEKFGRLIGFKRQSNYGVMFDVISKPDPNNLAYTSLSLPLHTDLANQEFIPGNQFLHCYRNEAKGGGSVFADAMTILDEFKADCPEQYQLLSELAVPWHFKDKETDLRQHRPVIGLDHNGNFKSLTFNAHLAGVPDFDAETLYTFYAAYREIMCRIRSAKHNIEYELKGGEMVIFDNQRVLHGRTSFDPESGSRHLRGYYIEHNEIGNRIRMLDKEIHPC